MTEATDKQKKFLAQLGFTGLIKDRKDASELIQSLSQFKKADKSPVEMTYEKPVIQSAKDYKPKFDTSSYYVAYAKDLCIAMLNVHAEARKLDPKLEPVMVSDMMAAAIECIQTAKEAFN